MDLLTPEERIALQDPFGAALSPTAAARPATFRSVGHLDPAQINALRKNVISLMDPICRELSRQLRVPCQPESPMAQILAPRLLPPAEDEAVWMEVRGCTGHQIVVSFPRVFAAAVCERVFGAPLLLRDERTLAAAETALLREFVRSWFPFFTRVWKDCEFRICSGPDRESRQESRPVDWLMFTTPVECGAIRGALSVAMSPATARLLLGEAPNASLGEICREQVTLRLGEVPVELRAVLGRAEFTMDELSGLRVGDVIALNRRASDPVDLYLDDRPFYRARAGLSGQTVALELLAESTEKKEQ